MSINPKNQQNIWNLKKTLYSIKNNITKNILQSDNNNNSIYDNQKYLNCNDSLESEKHELKYNAIKKE